MTIETYDYNWTNRTPDMKTKDLDQLHDIAKMRYYASRERERNLGEVVIEATPADIHLTGIGSDPLRFTNWSFSQLCTKIGAPPPYLKTLSPELLAENLNYSIARNPEATIRTIEHQPSVPGDVGIIRAINGSRYQRVHDHHILPDLASMLEDERDLQVNSIRVSDRRTTLTMVSEDKVIRAGKEDLRRGIQIVNSEVGAASFAVKLFWFRAICENGVIFGKKSMGSKRIRHVGARASISIADSLRELRGSSIWGNWEQERDIVEIAIKSEVASNQKGAQKWLVGKGVPKALAARVVVQAEKEEGRAGTAWELANGLTALARSSKHAEEKEEWETLAGDILIKNAKEGR